MRKGRVGWVVGALVSMCVAAGCGTSGSKPQSIDVAGVQRPATAVPLAAASTTTVPGDRNLFSAATTPVSSPKVVPPKSVPPKRVPPKVVTPKTVPPTTVPPTTVARTTVPAATAPPVTTKPTVPPPPKTVPTTTPPTTVAPPKGPVAIWFAANQAKFTALDTAATDVSTDMQYVGAGDQRPDLAANLTALAKAETVFQSALTASLPDEAVLARGVVLLKAASSDAQTAWNYLLQQPPSLSDAANWAYQVRSELYIDMSTITRSLVAGGAPAESVTAKAPPQ
jgi:hypothetical protein